MKDSIHIYGIKRVVDKVMILGRNDWKIILIFSFAFFMALDSSTQDSPEPIQISDTLGSEVLSQSFLHIVMPTRYAHGKDQILNVLKGQFSGINLTSSAGSPGASVSAVIRGYQTVLSSNAPLIVLDGMPINNDEWGASTMGVDLSNRAIDLNVMDIDSVTILKGPLATARYGLRGGNGVLLLKSKSGRTQKPKINIYTSIFAQSVSQMPERQSIYAQGRPINGIPEYRGPEKSEANSWGPELSLLEYDRTINFPYDNNGQLVDKGTGSGIPANAYDPYDFFVHDISYQTYMDLSGRTSSLDYFLSAGKSHSDGFSPKAKFDKSTIHGRLGKQISKALKIDFSGFYSSTQGYRLQKGANVNGIMLGLTRNTPTFDIGNGKKGNEAADDPETYTIGPESPRSYYFNYNNPYWSVNKNPFDDKVSRQIYNVSLHYKLNHKTWLFGRIGRDSYVDKRIGGYDMNNDSRVTFARPGSVFTKDVNHSRTDADIQLVYNHLKFDKLRLSGLFGWNYYQTKTEDRSVTGNEMISPGIFTLENTKEQVSEIFTISRKLIGIYADAKLSYDRFFQLVLVARNDWSSTLSATGGSNLSYALQGDIYLNEITGLSQNGWIDFATLRIGHGRTANDAPPFLTNNYFTELVVNGDNWIPAQEDIELNGIQQYEISSFKGNDNLSAEKISSFEVGLDFSIGEARLRGGITFYKQVTSDLILPNYIATSTGHDMWFANSGKISNSGMEVDLGFRIINSKSMEWNIGFHYTKNDNVVEELPFSLVENQLGGFNNASSRLIEGSPYGVLYGDRFQRADRGVLLIDQDGWPIHDPDRKIIGDPNPDWTLAVDQQIKLFDFITISAIMDVMSGGDLWCGTCGTMNYFGTSKETGDRRFEKFVFTGVREDGSQNTTPVTLGIGESGFLFDSYWTKYGFGGIAEENVHKASWIRLRNITVGFQLPQSVMKRLPVTDISINLFANNILLITNYPGIDPETNLEGTSNGSGIDYQNTPGRKFAGIGIHISI